MTNATQTAIDARNAALLPQWQEGATKKTESCGFASREEFVSQQDVLLPLVQDFIRNIVAPSVFVKRQFKPSAKSPFGSYGFQSEKVKLVLPNGVELSCMINMTVPRSGKQEPMPMANVVANSLDRAAIKAELLAEMKAESNIE